MNKGLILLMAWVLLTGSREGGKRVESLTTQPKINLTLIRNNSSPVTFTDVTSLAWLDLEGLGGGAAWGDYDQDCDLDLYVTNFSGSLVNRLYQNNGDGTFTDVTGTSGVGDARDCQGTAFGDFDNDGDLDIYVANWTNQQDAFYRNNGDETFTDIAISAGIVDNSTGHGMAWADYNQDGLLDMYVANTGEPNFLYRNNGDGTFTDIAGAAGVLDPGGSASSTFGDFDNDGDSDLYISEFFGPNILFRNNGNGTFTDVTASKGVGDPGFSSAASFGDYDNDGDLDLYVGNRGSSNTLYQNDGPPNFTFTDVTGLAGVGDIGISGGVSFGDYDNDGFLDLHLSNGVSVGGPDVLYRNNGNGTFSDVTASAGVGDPGPGHGSIWGDYDNDGDLDIFVVNSFGSNTLYRNNGSPNNWLAITTVGTLSNRNGVGARIKVEAGSLTMIQEVSGGDGHDTQNSLPVEFGLGSNLIADLIEVRWPSGIVDVCDNVPGNHFITVIEGEGCFKTSAPGCPCEPVEPPQMRTQGYWKRQCKDNPHEDICETMTEVKFLSDHFDDFDCEAICDLMSIEPPENEMCRKAERQFMALLLNVASGKLSPCNCLSDGSTVGDVIQQIDSLLSGSPDHFTCERAKTLADDINNGVGLVDCNSRKISFGEEPSSVASSSTQPNISSFLLEASPNPFNSLTLIRFQIPLPPLSKGDQGGFQIPVRLAIYDLSGRLIRTLLNSESPLTDHPLIITKSWDGRDDVGERVPSGIYFSCLKTGEWGATERIVFLH